MRTLWPILGMGLVLAPVIGCGLARPSSAPPTFTPLPPPTAAISREPPTRRVKETLTPTPETAEVLRLVITDEPIQYWSDPNDIGDLVYDGVYLWAATRGGVLRWSQDGSYRLYTLQDGLASLAVRGMALDGEGRLWVGYADRPAWSVYDGTKWQTFAERQAAVEAHYEAMRDARHLDPRLWYRRPTGDWLWLPDGQGRLQAYDGKRWRLYTEYHGITRHIWMVVVSPTGQVWALGSGLSTAQEGEVWWDDHTLFSDIADRRQVTDMAPDGAEGIWLAFVGQGGRPGGLCRVTPDGESVRWRAYMPEMNPSIPPQVYTLQTDEKGTIWVGGDGGISWQQPGRPWQMLALEKLPVRSFVRQQGLIWLGTAKGLWRTKPDGSELQGPWRVPSPLRGHHIVALAEDRAGRLYIGMPNGLSMVAPDGATTVLLEEEILCLATTSEGRVWAGSTAGLVELVDAKPERRLDQATRAIAFDQHGVLYLIDQEGRLATLREGALAVVADLRELIGSMPRNLVIDSQGTAWFSSENGLGGLKADGAFEHYTEENGLLSRDVRWVALGKEDTLWLATDYGLARRLANGRWTRFTTQSTEGGLLSHEMWATYVDAEDVLWMATSAGISYRTPDVDWANLELADAHCTLPTARGVWVGTSSGLYLVQKAAMTVLP
ncbi:MAG: hypothetical protein H5T69_05730 [Chloroflexi bacterium]|nr:hypothetical protein [Chloroflexota bacterium]